MVMIAMLAAIVATIMLAKLKMITDMIMIMIGVMI